MGSDEPALVGRMVELATTYRRYGYRRVTALLRSEGFAVNHKRVERLWRQEGLKVPQKQPKRGRLWLNDGSCVRLRPERKNHVWSYDFVHARTRDGRAFRMLTLIDEFTRECLAIDVARKLKSDDVRKEITKSVLGALAKLRKGLAAESPSWPGVGPARRPPTGRPPQEADRRQGRRVVRASLPLRAAPAESLRTCDAGEDQPRPASASQSSRVDGEGLPTLRSSVPDGHGLGQAGEAADPVTAVRRVEQDAEEAVRCWAGKGVGVPGREAVGSDLKRGGERKSALPEDAKDGVPRADASCDRGPIGVGPAPRATGPKSGRDDQDPPRSQGGMTRHPCYSV